MNCPRCGQSFEGAGVYCEKCAQPIARNRKVDKQKQQTMNSTTAPHVTAGVSRTTNVPEDVWIGRHGHMFRWGGWLLLTAVPMVLTMGVLYLLIDVWDVIDFPETDWPLTLILGYLMLAIPIGVVLVLLGIGSDVIQRGWKHLSRSAKWGLGLGLAVTALLLVSVCMSNLPETEDETTSDKEAQSQSETFSAPGVLTVQEARSQGLLSQEDEERSDLWRERDTHWDTLNAMDGVIRGIQEDKVTSVEEAEFLCTIAPQWIEQLSEVMAYARRLYAVDETTAKTLFKEVGRRQEAVIELQKLCTESR